MAPIDEALEALKSLKIGESPNYTDYAKKYGCDRSTLSRRHRGVTRSHTEKCENQLLLNATQEKAFIQYIDELCTRGLPPSREMIRNFASEIAGRQAGKSWVDRFIKRNQIDLITRWASGIDVNRKRADSAFKYTLYFELLRRKIDEYKIDACHMYNMDEKGFLIGVLSKMKRVFSRRRYEEGGIKQQLQDGNREWITTIACICADGTSLTPTLIYQAASGNIQDTWLQDFDPTEHNAFFASSPSGWTNNQLGLAWLQQVFDRETKSKARQSYRLLILDGHGSHVTMDFIKYCDDNKILLAIYPPHSTHTLQPLDVCMFKPLSAAYSTELANYMNRCQGLSSITKRDFFCIFNKAWQASFKSKTILKAFETTGLSPFDPKQVLNRFNIEQQDRPSSSDSTTSVLSASDWRKIERLLRKVVNDIYDKQSRQLSQTVHTISVRNTLLQHENNCLREALINEKRRRQRGKPLLLEAPPQYDGGAIFWSPNKVKSARDRQTQKEQEAKALQLQKDELIKLKEAQKAEKARMLEERKRTRVAARELRLQEQQAKAARREDKKIAREANRQLQNDIKEAKRGKKKTAMHVLSTHEDIDVDLSSGVDMVHAPARTRGNRQINLPARYRT
jgi:hypothetical protein